MPINEEYLAAINEKVKKLDFGLLLTGLIVLSKDLAEYLTINAYFSSQVQLFQTAYFSTLNDNRDFGKWYARNLYLPIAQSGYPFGFSQNAMQENFDISALCDSGIVKECGHCFGWDLFKRFKLLLKPALCKENGPIQQFEAGNINSSQLTIELAKCILIECFGSQYYWYPLAVYIACLFTQTDYQHYCNPPQSPKAIPTPDTTDNEVTPGSPVPSNTVSGNAILATTTTTTEIKADS